MSTDALYPLIFQPVFRDYMWGGRRLERLFGRRLPPGIVAESWEISAHPSAPTAVANWPYSGVPLPDLTAQLGDRLLGTRARGTTARDRFPLLVKLLDATRDLSVQVHPDDAYGLEHEGELGKTECWYIIDADKDAEIIYGHNAQSKEQFSGMIAEGNWDGLLRHVKVKKGDFFFVPSGTIHAIGGGITILETQQSSNTTYRVYDFDRKDDQGKTRDLHIQQSIDVSMIPHKDPSNRFETATMDDNTVTTFIESDYFSVYKWDIHSEMAFKKTTPYTLASVIEGSGSLTVDGKTYPLQKGDHFILPATVSAWSLAGDMELIASNPGPKNS